MATGVEIVSTIRTPPVYVSSASTLQLKSKIQLKSANNVRHTQSYRDEIVTKYIKSPLFVNEEYYRFLNTLDQHDINAITTAVEEIASYPFVEKIEFETSETPTIIIKLSEINRENKNVIYGIEYDLLSEIKTDIDFYIRPF